MKDKLKMNTIKVRRLGIFFENVNNKEAVDAFAERFIGLGNNGKSFCECNNCVTSDLDCPCNFEE